MLSADRWTSHSNPTNSGLTLARKKISKNGRPYEQKRDPLSFTLLFAHKTLSDAPTET